ncbi:ABC transporter substrate-binding protein [Spirochaeta isovalerica]|uniref:Raffinose/stachyose/melibiose transport system substrate-binding protein n=1 Tax=Spirochaeta isovalerica TaxID=150 RepID=A0A841R3V3_9SPIO|nr:extracellular solute-binding protein [Spirochaeta isovalerica]MBB6479754.1 raffinose/stachyose/melibiose transport system substrate-binding protein [Spirochaeta isovalerica]
MKKIFAILFSLTMILPLFSNGQQEGAKTSEIQFFSWYSTETDSYEEQLLATVASKVDGVAVEIEPVVWDQMHSLLQARIAGGSMPDLLDFKGQDIAKYGKAGNLMELTGSWIDEYISPAARENLQIDGKDYGLPYSALFQGVLYNRDIFDKYDLKIPETYEELMEVAAVLKSNGVTPFVSHMADNWHIGNITMQFAMSEVFNENPGWGADLYDGKVTFEDSEGYRNVFKHVKDIYDNTWEDTFSVDFGEATARFGRGEAAMFATGTWSNRNLQEFPELDYGIFPFPGEKAGAKLIFEPNHTYGVAATTENPEKVMEVLKAIITDKELAATFVDEASAYSLVNGVQPSSPYPCDSDIDRYKADNAIVDVSIGNNQIKWAYQEEYSRYIAEWLLGSKTLDEALAAATAHKENVPR